MPGVLRALTSLCFCRPDKGQSQSRMSVVRRSIQLHSSARSKRGTSSKMKFLPRVSQVRISGSGSLLLSACKTMLHLGRVRLWIMMRTSQPPSSCEACSDSRSEVAIVGMPSSSLCCRRIEHQLAYLGLFARLPFETVQSPLYHKRLPPRAWEQVSAGFQFAPVFPR